MEDMSLDDLLGALQSAQEEKPKVCPTFLRLTDAHPCSHMPLPI